MTGEWRLVADGISEAENTFWFEFEDSGADQRFVVDVPHNFVAKDRAREIAGKVVQGQWVRERAAGLSELGKENAFSVATEADGVEEVLVWRMT